MEEITLFDGTLLRIQPVPNLAAAEVVSYDPSLATPPLPIVEHQTKFGVQRLSAKEGEEEYAEWMKEVEEVEKRRLRAQTDFTWDYGVIEWKLPDSDKWVDEPPKDWELPKRLKKYGFEPSRYGARVDYIKYHLLRHGEDLTNIQSIIYGINAPLTKEEVAQVRETFQGDEVREETG